MIKVENLCKRFGAKTVVNDVSFSVERGEIHTETGRLDQVFRAITLPDTLKAA